MSLKKGDIAPDFTLPSTSGENFTLSNYKGKPLIIYFYPMDFTPGCTKEACTFGENHDAFKNSGVDVFGISTDSIEKHVKFKNKHQLPFELLSDKKGEVAKLYGALLPFMNMTRRITFLIGADQKIIDMHDSLFNYKSHIHSMLKKLDK